MQRSRSSEPAPGAGGVQIQALARHARAGCRASYAELVRRYAGPLQDFLRARGASRCELEDLVQETFTVAWEKIELYDEHYAFSTWLFTVAQRLVVDDWRRRRPQLAGAERLDGEGGEEDPLLAAGRSEERENLWDLAREVLSRDQFTALWLSYAEGVDTGEIARILGRARPTVRVLLFRARAILRGHLEATEPRWDEPGAEAAESNVCLGGQL